MLVAGTGVAPLTVNVPIRVTLLIWFRKSTVKVCTSASYCNDDEIQHMELG
jgi:hypothetical protein